MPNVQIRDGFHWGFDSEAGRVLTTIGFRLFKVECGGQWRVAALYIVVVRVQRVQERTKVCYLEAAAAATGWSWKRGQQRSLIIYII